MLPLATTVNINFPTDTSSLLGTHKITLSACLPLPSLPLSRPLVSIAITLDYAAEIVITLRCDLHFKSHDESFESIACSSRHLLWLSIGLILLPFAPSSPSFPFTSVDCNFSLDKRLPRDGEADKNQPIRSTSELSFWGDQGSVQEGRRERLWEGNWKYLQKNLA